MKFCPRRSHRSLRRSSTAVVKRTLCVVESSGGRAGDCHPSAANRRPAGVAGVVAETDGQVSAAGGDTASPCGPYAVGRWSQSR